MNPNTKVGILSAGGSSPSYTFNLLFQDGTDAQFLRIGDVVTSFVTGDRYQISTWVGNPSDFVSNGSVTATALDADIVPSNDGGFNSRIDTPNQVHPFPNVQDQGTLGLVSIFSGQDFEWNATYAPVNGVSAAKSVVGDAITDVNGRTFLISFLDPTNRFTVPIRLTEVDAVGEPPVGGAATLYTPTPNFGLFNGSELNGAAHNNATNRSRYIADINLGVGGSSNGDFQLLSRTITVGEDSAKKLTLSPVPADTDEVAVFIIGGSSQKPGIDYEIINGNELSWNALGLDGILASGDILLLLYFSV